ncbi:hypothetical protein BC937DRAFT_92740 [Endogone sp. FLAS-F59071]|nr:hypothetical protein BC937DRAFT_92740 [Endogone sp. FLAS-F59071]|eukprot:RUS15215.1 hypothetical protein BC937DRAFT_92740 [Endogone sp. FLAS-F59071]
MAEQTRPYPPNSLRGLPLELSYVIVDLLPTAAQKQLRLVDRAFKELITPRVFKRIVIPETAGRKESVIPTGLINNATSITIPKKRPFTRRSTRLATNRKTVIPAITQPFINKLFNHAPLINQVCIQHPISLSGLQTIFNILGTRLRSLAITGEAFLVTLCKLNGLKFLETSAAISELEQLKLTPMGLHSVIKDFEEIIFAKLIHRSSATLRYLDLGWGSPIQLIAIPDALDKCRNLTALNLNGYAQCANMLPFLLKNNSRLKSLCLLDADIAGEPADGNVARAFLTFTGAFSHLEITCLRALPDWFPSAHCFDTLNALVIETETVDVHLAQWILQLGELRNVKFISAKFESIVNYTQCLHRATVLQLHKCELSLASLGELVQPMLALTSLAFFNVDLTDNDTTYDTIHTILDQSAVQNLRRRFATNANTTDITLRLWLCSKNELIPDDEPVPLHLHQKWLESRSKDNNASERSPSHLESDEMVSTDEEFGIVDDESNENEQTLERSKNGESKESDDNGDGDDEDGDDEDDDDNDAFAKVLDEALAASPSSSITSFSFLSGVITPPTFVPSLDTDEQLARQLQVQEELLFREDQETISSSSVAPTERDLNTSNKRDRIKLGDSVSDDDRRSGKRLCTDESKAINSPSSASKITFNRGGKGKNKSKRTEKLARQLQVREKLLDRKVQETASLSSVTPMERDYLNTSNKRDRIKPGSTVSGDDERSGKRLCTDESKVIDSTVNIAFNLGGKSKSKGKEVKNRTTIKQQARKMMG